MYTYKNIYTHVYVYINIQRNKNSRGEVMELKNMCLAWKLLNYIFLLHFQSSFIVSVLKTQLQVMEAKNKNKQTKKQVKMARGIDRFTELFRKV